MIRVSRQIVCAAVLLVAAAAPAAPLFDSQEPLKAVLSLPLSQIYRQARQSKQLYMPGNISYRDDNGKTVRLPVRARARGEFRRQNCSRPPLRLNFKKSDLGGSLFAGQDKLKLVNACTVRPRAEQQLALEYLAYRAYEILSDHSFRTRLLNLSYQDNQGKLKVWSTTAFLIEDEGEMIKRLGGSPLEARSISRSALDPTLAARLELFQFMIGNTDYSMIRVAEGRDCCHNVKLIKAGDDAAPLYKPVAYDFDYSGLVDAPYAKPPESLPISRVRQRYYMGYCRNRSYLDAAIAQVRARKAALLALFAESTLLEGRTRRRSLQYLEEFFELIDSPKRVNREIINRCRG